MRFLRYSFVVNPVQSQTAAGKLKRLVRSHARGVAIIFAAFVSLGIAASPAFAELRVERFAVSARNKDGSVDVQAGSHPYSLTTTFVLEPGQGDLKDARLELPPGLIGNPDATPRCTYQEFAKQELGEPSCENATAVGVATSYLYAAGEPEHATPFTEPVYNLVPPKGVAAEFGFVAAKKTPVLLTTSVRTGEDYGVTTTVSNVNQAALVRASKVTIWGIPAEESHNGIRGQCENVQGGNDEVAVYAPGRGLWEGEDELETPIHQESEPGYNPEIDNGLPEPAYEGADCPAGGPLTPLLTNPTSCGVPRTASFSVDSWEEPGAFESKLVSMPEIVGCGSLDFSPTVGFSMEKSAGSTPSGLVGDIRVPQEATENPSGLAEADVKNSTVTLPVGMQVNPSSADGLAACSDAQVGYTGMKELEPTVEPGILTPQFKEKVSNPETGVEESDLCPNASKIGTVAIKTPLLEGELHGSVYLASPRTSPACRKIPLALCLRST